MHRVDTEDGRAGLRDAATKADDLLIPMQGRAVIYLLDLLEASEQERDAMLGEAGTPHWEHGVEVNLLASAMDALTWMRWFRDTGMRRYVPGGPPDMLTRLSAATDALADTVNALHAHCLTCAEKREETSDVANP